jgi:lipoate-protein ligase A
LRVVSLRPFRLLLQEPGNGQRNMAEDEALLHSVGAGQSPPTIRLYGFSPPTLSVGRFQHIRERLDGPALAQAGYTLVRRPTGGQAVLHDRELTYAVALQRGQVEPFGKREVYRFVAQLLLEGLRALGIEAQSSRSRMGSVHQPDCFRSTGEYEIADLARRKLIGSAQLLSREGSLQHGAIPLDDSYRHLASFVRIDSEEAHLQPASLSQELGRPVGFAEAVGAFSEGFARGLEGYGLSLQQGELSAEEQGEALRLLESRYTLDTWNLMY